MILFELTGSEQHPVYQYLEIANGNRQYDFLRSIVTSAIDVKQPFLSQQIIKALNFQAITCLHTNAGEYRPCPVHVGSYSPPEHYRVPALMDEFVNSVNRRWQETDPVVLAAFVLWKLNYIHPFINGNGRTARATCYFVLCLSAGGWLPGDTIIPELLRRDRVEYVAALKAADETVKNGPVDLSLLHDLLTRLLIEQLATVPTGGEFSEQEITASKTEDPPAGSQDAT
jgi:Fic family protein